MKTYLNVIVYEVSDHICNVLVDQDDRYVISVCEVLECVLDFLGGRLCSANEPSVKMSLARLGSRRQNGMQCSLSLTMRKFDFFRKSTFPTPAKRKPVIVSSSPMIAR